MKRLLLPLFLCALLHSAAQTKKPRFVVNLGISNLRGNREILEFGTAPDATSGYECICLDSAYGEFEIPPPPSDTVFDARWFVANSSGTHRNIFPEAYPGTPSVTQFSFYVQAGQETDLNTGQTFTISYPYRLAANCCTA